jgi:transcription-repair coupling factor (superfamily II helicase)
LAARKTHGKDALKSLARDLLGRDAPVRLTGLRGAARAVLAAELIRAHGDRPVLILGPSAKSCDMLVDDLRTSLGEREDASRLHVFPRHDTLPYDRFSPQPFIVTQRMDVLYRWLRIATGRAHDDESPPVVVSDWSALALRVPARAAIGARTAEIQVGQEIGRDLLIARLVAAGYTRMPLVEEPGGRGAGRHRRSLSAAAAPSHPHRVLR